MYGKLMLGITVPVLFSVINVCALGKRFFFQFTFILCVVMNKEVSDYVKFLLIQI